MITKFLSKLKSILFDSAPTVEANETKTSTAKNKKKSVKSSKATKSTAKSKKEDPKKLIENLKAIPGIGAKSAEAFYKAGFKTPKSIKSAKDEDLLAVPGVGINLVKKIKSLK